MKYRIAKEKLEAKGFYLSAHQTDYELPMLHYQHPTIKGSNWEITLHFSHDTVIPEDVENGREYSFDEEWVLDAEISAIESAIDISISFMSSDVLDISGGSDDNIIYLCGEDLNLFDKVLDLVTDPYVSINFAKEYSQKVADFMDWVNPFIPSFKKLKLIPYPHARSGNSSTLYRSIGIKFELHDYAGIWFEMDVLTWKMHGHIKIAPGFCENDSAYFDSTTSIKDFRTELGVQYQEHLWYLEKMKNVRAISATDVILKDGTRVKYSEL
jgi:hypothetical protein